MDSHFQDLFDQATASLRRAQECLAEFAQLRQDSGQQDNLTGSRMNESERKPARDDERSNDERASEEELRQVIIPKLIEVITLPKLIEVLLNLAHQDESSYLTEAETTTPRILFATQGCLLLIDRENAQVSVHHEEELTLEYEDIGDACFDVIDFAEARRQRQAVALRRSERRTPGWQRCGSASTLVSRRSRIVQSRVKPERESDQRFVMASPLSYMCLLTNR